LADCTRNNVLNYFRVSQINLATTLYQR